MSSVLSANAASSTPRVAAPVASRPVDSVVAPGREPAATVVAGKAGKASEPATANRAPTLVAPAPALTKAELARQVHALQVKMDKLNPALAFVVDQDSGRAVIQLTDRATKEVIQQFPSEAAMQISKALDRFQKGQLIDLTA
jgi:flagellar protein FlaG